MAAMLGGCNMFYKFLGENTCQTNSFTNTPPKSALQSREGDYNMLATSIGTNSKQNCYFYGNHHTEYEYKDDQI